MLNSPPGVSQQATLATHVHLKRIAGDHEALQQQHAGSVADQAVAFHLPQTQASISRATFRRLPAGERNIFVTPLLEKYWLLSSTEKEKKRCSTTASGGVEFYLMKISWLILPGEDSSGAPGPGVHLIEDHVLQFLIIHRSEVDVRFQGFPEEKRATRRPPRSNPSYLVNSKIPKIRRIL